MFNSISRVYSIKPSLIDLKLIQPNKYAAAAASAIAEKGISWNEARGEILEKNPQLSASQLPTDDQIETALREHYAIFDPVGHKERLRELRMMALTVMQELSNYSPLLTKGVLNGCADKYSNIYIDVFAEDPKELEIFLLDRNIDYESYPIQGKSKRDPIGELVVEAPSLKEGILRNEHISVWVVLKIYDSHYKATKKRKKEPDPWQIMEESNQFASIEDLKKILEKTF